MEKVQNNRLSMLWSILDDFKNVGISVSEYWTILFLLVAFKNEAENSNIDFRQSTDQNARIFESLEKLSKKLDISHKSGFSHIVGTIKQFNPDSLNSISKKMIALLESIPNEDFSDLFDDALYDVLQYNHGRDLSSLQPRELTDFVASLINKEKFQYVYNPFAGPASYEIALKGNHYYLGEEINEVLWLIGKLRLFVHKKVSQKIAFKNEYSFVYDETKNNKFDVIVSNPPFGRVVGSGNRSYEQILIETSKTKLSESGRMFIIVSESFLTTHEFSRQVRKSLVLEDILEMVITLPSVLQQSSAIKMALLIVNKNKAVKDNVDFVDGSSFFKKISTRKFILDKENLLEVISENNPKYFTKISNFNIIRNDLLLDPARYLILNDDIIGKPISSIATLDKGSKNYSETFGKVVKVKNLEKDFVIDPFNVAEIDAIPLSSKTYRKIDFSCVLISVRYENLKPTFFNYTGTPIFISADITALRINEELISPLFLINELHSNNVQKQLKVLRYGVISSIREKDLMSIKINVPTLQEQSATIAGLLQSQSKLERLRKEKEKIQYGADKSTFNEFASLKHTLGTPRQNISDWTINILKFIQKYEKEFSKMNTEFKNFYEVDLKTAMMNIKTDINFITEVLEKGENGLVMEKYPIDYSGILELKNLLESISTNGLNFNLRIVYPESGLTDDIQIMANLPLLRTLFDNLLTNANKHGFNSYQHQNEVVIELLFESGQLVIEVKNNGVSFPDKMDKEKFITKYATADSERGSGLGGYDIDRIAKYFHTSNLEQVNMINDLYNEKRVKENNEAWELILNDDPVYPVIFRFRFNIWAKAMTL